MGHGDNARRCVVVTVLNVDAEKVYLALIRARELAIGPCIQREALIARLEANAEDWEAVNEGRRFVPKVRGREIEILFDLPRQYVRSVGYAADRRRLGLL